MENYKELPEITFGGTTWLVDTAGFQLLEKGNLSNNIEASEIMYSPMGYSFPYSKSRRTAITDIEFLHANYSEKQLKNDIIYVQMPQFVEMDLEGVSRKYGWSPEDLVDKKDYEILLDRQLSIDAKEPLRCLFNDIIFEEYRDSGKAVLEIPMDEYLKSHLVLVKEFLDEVPQAAEKMEQDHPDLKKSLDEIYHKLTKGDEGRTAKQQISDVGVGFENALFEFDFKNFNLIEIGNPSNIIETTEMTDTGSGYEFYYDPERKNIANVPIGFKEGPVGPYLVRIGYFTILHPTRIAKAHNIPLDQVMGRTDREFIANQKFRESMKQKPNDAPRQDRRRRRGLGK
ncbi:MAG: hypothetical protein KF860_10275 [Cyclobacteriaceae bacterium]|nr:hypothetical protein [Cyclobacteriaceae bacterium]